MFQSGFVESLGYVIPSKTKGNGMREKHVHLQVNGSQTVQVKIDARNITVSAYEGQTLLATTNVACSDLNIEIKESLQK